MSEKGKWEERLDGAGDHVFACGSCIYMLRVLDAISTPWRVVLGMWASMFVISIALGVVGIVLDEWGRVRAERRYRVRRAMRGEQ